MLTPTKFTALSLALLLALLMAAVFPISAFAQDEVPPPAEPAAAEVDPPAAEPAVDAPPSEDLTVPEVLEQLPAGTDLVVLDENGEALPLATQEAAEVIQTSDPMWCPSSATTVIGDCVNDMTVAGLLPKINTKIEEIGATAGTIYFTPSYTTNDVSFTDLDARDNALTLQGGWDGNTTLNSIITYSGSTVFSVPVSIEKWRADVTVNDVTISGIGALSTLGLYVQTEGDVVLDHVNSSSNNFDTQDYGMGADINTPGDVSISNSHFDANKDGLSYGTAGLNIGSVGNVKLQNVSANQNTDANGSGQGIYIGGIDDRAPASVTLTNVQANENNQGVQIVSFGDMTATDSVFNSNNNSRDTSYGLGIYSDGNVTLNNVTASYNKGNGAIIGGAFSGYLASVTIQNSFFNDNTTTTTDSQYGYGVNLSTSNSSSVKCSQFSGNSRSGIHAFGEGTLTNDSNTFSGNGIDVYLTNGATQVIMSSGGCVEVPAGVSQPSGENDGEHGFKAQNNLFQQGTIVTAQIIAVPAPLPLDELPAGLPEGKTYSAGASVKLMRDGEEVFSAPESVLVYLEIPAGMEAPFTVLSWNGTEWVEVPSEVVDGMVVFAVTGPGVYVLATGS